MPKSDDPLYKSVLCKNFTNGKCKYGKRCTFAHGKDDLKKKRRSSSKATVQNEAFDLQKENWPSLKDNDDVNDIRTVQINLNPNSPVFTPLDINSVRIVMNAEAPIFIPMAEMCH